MQKLKPVFNTLTVEPLESLKEKVRKDVWRTLERLNLAKFPRPVFGRIPNFVGAETAVKRLRELLEFQRARVVKVNPDSPQRPARKLVLSSGKLLIMPTPRLKGGFLLLDPKSIPKRAYDEASTIKGAFKYGKPISLNEVPKIDLMIAGSVAVSRDGSRIGKGGGYSEIEFAVLKEVGAISDDVPVITTVHDVQVTNHLPQDEHDVPVDVIVTPSKVIRTQRRAKPKGVIWRKVTSQMLNDMPVLKELRTISAQRASSDLVKE
jgi:5-formyltetrahydrofolate cyclo-ligase